MIQNGDPDANGDNHNVTDRNKTSTKIIEENQDNSNSGDFHRKQSVYDYIVIIVCLCIVVIGVYHSVIFNILQNNEHSIQNQSAETVNYDEILFDNDMDNLQEKYNIDDNSILKLKSGIKTTFLQMDAGSFMLIYNSKTHNFNAQEFEKFINEVADASSRYLRNDIYSSKHIDILSTNLDMEEYGMLINRYRNDLDRAGVLLVKEVDSVPSHLVMAFHYYCDDSNPLVKRSAIFFTLDLANCSYKSDIKPTYKDVEKCISEKWVTVPKENIKPLLSRMVDVIIDLSSVF